VPAPELPFVIIAPEFFREDLAQDLNPKLAAALAAAQDPTSLVILGAASGPGAWHTLRSWYAVSAADRVIDPALQRFMAQRARSTTVQFDHASHAGGFTHYAARFVKLIEQAAQATAS
jgi:Alpha/beta hydrolase family